MNKPAKALATKVLEMTKLPRWLSQAELDALADLAREVLGPKRRASKVVAVGRMKPSREQLDAETRKLKARALVRAGGRGELTGDPLTTAELCHLEGGNGSRRQNQRISNVLIETHENHQGPKGLDKDPERWLPAVKAWCAKYGHPLPERWKRLEIKIQMREARAAEARRLGVCDAKSLGHVPHKKNSVCVNWRELPGAETPKEDGTRANVPSGMKRPAAQDGGVPGGEVIAAGAGAAGPAHRRGWMEAIDAAVAMLRYHCDCTHADVPGLISLLKDDPTFGYKAPLDLRTPESSR